jgi:hypothetical protein
MWDRDGSVLWYKSSMIFRLTEMHENVAEGAKASEDTLWSRSLFALERGYYLMRIEVNLVVDQGRRETIDRRRVGPLGQFVSKIPGMVWRQSHIPCNVQKHKELSPLLRLQYGVLHTPKVFRIKESNLAPIVSYTISSRQ